MVRTRWIGNNTNRGSIWTAIGRSDLTEDRLDSNVQAVVRQIRHVRNAFWAAFGAGLSQIRTGAQVKFDAFSELRYKKQGIAC
jgi:hypothetical protein